MALFSELGVSQAEAPILLGKTTTNYGAGGGSPPSGTVFSETVAETVNFSETIALLKTLNLTVIETVEFSGIASVPNIVDVAASDTVNFSDTAISSLKTLTVVETVEFGDAGNINQTLDFAINETVEFSDTAISSLKTLTVVETVEFGDSTFPGAGFGSATSVAASDTVEFSDVAARTKILAAAQSLSVTETVQFTDRATIPIERTVAETVNFSDSTSTEYIKTVIETVIFSDSVILNQVLNLTVSETIQFSDFSAYETNNPSLCTYSPNVGSGGGGNTPTPPSGTPPILTRSSTVTLFYPTTSPTDSVTIRAPEFGNRDRLVFERINRESRGGTLQIFADTNWAKTQRLVLTFTGLSESEGQSVLDFFETTLGLEIGFTDWENRTWHGVILTPEEPLVRNHRTYVDLSFEFEGTLQ